MIPDRVSDSRRLRRLQSSINYGNSRRGKKKGEEVLEDVWSMFGCLISWNIRRINNYKKRQVIRICLNRWKPDVICLQKSKMEYISDWIVRDLWKNREIGWKDLPVRGTSGGFWSFRRMGFLNVRRWCWGNALFHACMKIVEMSGNGYSLVSATEVERGFPCGRTWRIANKNGTTRGLWEDFNMILYRHSRSRDHFLRVWIEEFKETLDRIVGFTSYWR